VEEFTRQSGGGNYSIKMNLSDSGDDAGEFSSHDVKVM